MAGLMERIARMMAVLGGVILTVLIVMVCISIAGRGGNTFGHWDWLEQAAPEFASWLVGTGIGPIPGDFELVEAGVAFAIFAFLPLCQLHSGHATVDLFTTHLPARVRDALIAFWEVVLAALILLITWRLLAGMLNKVDNGETTFILQFPIWWAYAASFLAACVASVIAIYCAAARVATALTGRPSLPQDDGAGH